MSRRRAAHKCAARHFVKRLSGCPVETRAGGFPQSKWLLSCRLQTARRILRRCRLSATASQGKKKNLAYPRALISSWATTACSLRLVARMGAVQGETFWGRHRG